MIVLLASTLQRSLCFSNIKIVATFAGDFVDHTYCLTLLSVEAAAVNLVAAGAFLLSSFFDVLGCFNSHHVFLLYVP